MSTLFYWYIQDHRAFEIVADKKAHGSRFCTQGPNGSDCTDMSTLSQCSERQNHCTSWYPTCALISDNQSCDWSDHNSIPTWWAMFSTPDPKCFFQHYFSLCFSTLWYVVKLINHKNDNIWKYYIPGIIALLTVRCGYF